MHLTEHLPASKNRRGLLSAEALRVLHTPVEGSHFAPGWQYQEQSWLGPHILWHNGSDGRYFAQVHVDRARNFGIVVLTNAAGDRATAGTHEADRLLVDWVRRQN